MENRGRQTQIIDSFDPELLAQQNGRPRHNNRGRQQAQGGSTNSRRGQNQGQARGRENPSGWRRGLNQAPGARSGKAPARITTKREGTYEDDEIKVPLYDDSGRLAKARSVDHLKKRKSLKELKETINQYDKTGSVVRQFQALGIGKEAYAVWIHDVEVKARGESTPTETVPEETAAANSTEPSRPVNRAAQNGYSNGRPVTNGTTQHTQARPKGRPVPSRNTNGVGAGTGPKRKREENEEGDRNHKKVKPKLEESSEDIVDNPDFAANVTAGLENWDDDWTPYPDPVEPSPPPQPTVPEPVEPSPPSQPTVPEPVEPSPPQPTVHEPVESNPPPRPTVHRPAVSNRPPAPRPAVFNRLSAPRPAVSNPPPALRRANKRKVVPPPEERELSSEQRRIKYLAHVGLPPDYEVPPNHCVSGSIFTDEKKKEKMLFQIQGKRITLEQPAYYDPVPGGYFTDKPIPDPLPPPNYKRAGNHGYYSNDFQGRRSLITGEGHQVEPEDRARARVEFDWMWDFFKKYNIDRGGPLVPAQHFFDERALFASGAGGRDRVTPEDREKRIQNEDWIEYYKAKYPGLYTHESCNDWPCGCETVEYESELRRLEAILGWHPEQPVLCSGRVPVRDP